MCQVCEQHRALLSRSRLTHHLAAFDGLLLALRHAGMTRRRKGIDRQRPIMGHRRVKRQHQRWTVPYDPSAGVARTMDPAFGAFGTFDPTLHVHMVGRQLSRLAPPSLAFEGEVFS